MKIFKRVQNCNLPVNSFNSLQFHVGLINYQMKTISFRFHHSLKVFLKVTSEIIAPRQPLRIAVVFTCKRIQRISQWFIDWFSNGVSCILRCQCLLQNYERIKSIQKCYKNDDLSLNFRKLLDYQHYYYYQYKFRKTIYKEKQIIIH